MRNDCIHSKNQFKVKYKWDADPIDSLGGLSRNYKVSYVKKFYVEKGKKKDLFSMQ